MRDILDWLLGKREWLRGRRRRIPRLAYQEVMA